MDDLLQEFIAETRETLAALSGEIVAWEAAPNNRERLDSIFRFVHTVKGSCGFLDLPRLSRLSHAAEDVLATIRSGERVPDTALVSAVLAIVDRIGDLVEAIEVGVPLDDSNEDLLIAALEKGAQAAAPSVTPALRSPTRSVRLNVDLLDRMMSGMSDMVLARNELARRVRDDGADPVIEAALERLSLTVAEMRDTVTRTRMQKIDALFSALPRMVRDTASELGKSVILEIDGSDVELDREMIEMMRDPLAHIVRNSIDHGIERPAERRIAGKGENGRLMVTARQAGNQIIIEIADDGRGIDVDRLIAKIASSGTRSEAQLQALNHKAKLDLIFEPGLSTKDVATAISGRGVGMDVVRANVEQIGGRIELTNLPEKGLRIAIHVPLTLSIISTIGVGTGGQHFAIARQAIEEIVAVRGDAVRIDMLGGTPVVTLRGRRMPLIDLGTLLCLKGGTPGMLVIVAISGGSYALAVDVVLDHEELVVKPAAPAVMSAGVYAGQTLPDNGLPMLLLDCAGVAAVAGLHFTAETSADDELVEVVTPPIQTLLFDDLDGVRRLVPLSVVDRVESVSIDAIRFSAGALRLSADGRIVPLVARGKWTDYSRIFALRLHDGEREVSYAVREALDIVALPDAMIMSREPGFAAGVVMLDGEQIELLDLHYLFSTYTDAAARQRPLCLLSGSDSAWMTAFLTPVLEGAGYRVSTAPAAGERASVVLMMDEVETNVDAPTVRLRREANAKNGCETVYRYDRLAVLAAVTRTAETSS